MAAASETARPIGERVGGSCAPQAWVETVLLVLVFFLFAGSAPPAENEAHYLAKARHFWDPSYCPGDLFLGSRDAHLVFYLTFGWVAAVLPLPAAAWVGRLLTWGLLGWFWRRLSWALCPRPWFSLLTSGTFVLLNEWLHLSGEWIIGGVEAKGFAYALVLAALHAMVQRQWGAAWLWLGAATSLHVLVGGWALVAYGLTWLAQGWHRAATMIRRRDLVAALLLAAPGVANALALSWGTPPDVRRQAELIYVYERLGHHLVFQMFTLARALGFATLLALWLLITWKLRYSRPFRRLNAMAVAAVVIALGGLALDQITWTWPGPAAALLRYYWFRLADVLVPLATALGCGLWLLRGAQRHSRQAAAGAVCLLLIVFGTLVAAVVVRWVDPRPPAVAQSRPLGTASRSQLLAAAEEWRAVCAWIRDHTRPDDQFLTPRGQQTFKWYAQRAEVCSWKDIPQDAASMVVWWERLQQVYPRGRWWEGLGAHSDSELSELGRQHGARYVLIDRNETTRALGFRRIFPNPELPESSFELYDLWFPLPKSSSPEAEP